MKKINTNFEEKNYKFWKKKLIFFQKTNKNYEEKISKKKLKKKISKKKISKKNFKEKNQKVWKKK